MPWRARAELDALVTTIAVIRYEAEHDEYPDSLAQLVEAGLPSARAPGPVLQWPADLQARRRRLSCSTVAARTSTTTAASPAAGARVPTAATRSSGPSAESALEFQATSSQVRRGMRVPYPGFRC